MTLADQLDRLTPLQRSVLDVLRRGELLDDDAVFRGIERLTPAGLDVPDAIRVAVRRALEQLVALELVVGTPDRRFSLPEPVLDATTYGAPAHRSALSL